MSAMGQRTRSRPGSKRSTSPVSRSISRNCSTRFTPDRSLPGPRPSTATPTTRTCRSGSPTSTATRSANRCSPRRWTGSRPAESEHRRLPAQHRLDQDIAQLKTHFTRSSTGSPASLPGLQTGRCAVLSGGDSTRRITERPTAHRRSRPASMSCAPTRRCTAAGHLRVSPRR